jgi:putative nucleotidyltransferase with HDIG domain
MPTKVANSITPDSLGLIPISPLMLNPDCVIGIDIYLWNRQNQEKILFASGNHWLNEAAMERLGANPELRLYIPKDQRDVYQTYLRQHVANWVHDVQYSTEVKMSAVAEVVRGVLQETFQTNETDSIVESSLEVSQHISGLVSNTPLNATELSKVLHHDYGTFTHSANVALYAGLLAKQLGFSGTDLDDITAGGLLHDIGKLDIDPRILNKPDKLDEFEFRLVKMHPLLGFQRLATSDKVNSTHLAMAYQHHERLDGGGYPVGVMDNEIDMAARICAVVDIFEALTSQRPYHSPMEQTKALQIMESMVGSALDSEIFRCWSKMIRLPSSA